MTDLDTLLAQATRPERTVRLCLRGDLTAALAQAKADLADAEERGGKSSLADTTLPRLREKVADLREQVDEATVAFTFQGLSRAQIHTVMRDSPVRKDDKLDAAAGYDRDRYSWLLVRASLTAPDLTDEQYERLFGTPDAMGSGLLTAAQFQRIDQVVSEVTFGSVDVPF